MANTKVILRVSTVGHKAGDTISVPSEQADYLVDNGHAVKASEAPAELKGK